MTAVTQSDISQSTQAVWRTVFGRPLSEVADRDRPAMTGTILLARVRILDDVPRSILIACPLEEARRIAALFFGREAATIEDVLVRDVFGELANMIGGLIKRHFPRSARLSLPEVTEESPESETGAIVQAAFACEAGIPLAVRLV